MCVGGGAYDSGCLPEAILCPPLPHYRILGDMSGKTVCLILAYTDPLEGLVSRGAVSLVNEM